MIVLGAILTENGRLHSLTKSENDHCRYNAIVKAKDSDMQWAFRQSSDESDDVDVTSGGPQQKVDHLQGFFTDLTAGTSEAVAWGVLHTHQQAFSVDRFCRISVDRVLPDFVILLK